METNDSSTGGIETGPCDSNAVCASRLCGSDNVCVEKASIVYVDESGSSDDECGDIEAPCVSIQDAIDMTSDARPLVLIGSGKYDEKVEVADKNLTLVGIGNPVLSFSGNDAASECPNGAICSLYVTGASHLTIDGIELLIDRDGVVCAAQENVESSLTLNNVTFRHSSTTWGNALHCDMDTRISRSQFINSRVELSSVNNPTPNFSTIRQSTFFQSKVATKRVRFELSNSMFINSDLRLDYIRDDGMPPFTYSQADINLQFNTFSSTPDGVFEPPATGFAIVCGYPPGLPITHRNSIALGPSTNRSLFQSDCAYTNSLVPPDIVGAGNFFDEPSFVNSSEGDFRIASNSPAKDALPGPFSIDEDIDGDTRPIGDGYDIGADEFSP